jgi:putative ABC transport system permease protein
MMLGRETWSVAIDALRANKLRAFLTMLGVMIGAACIVLVVTVSLTGRRFILGQIESIGTNVIDAHAVHSLTGPTALSYELTLEDMDAIRHGIPGVVYVAGTRVLDASVVVNGNTYPVTLVGVTQEYEDIRHLLVTSGRYYDEDDVTNHAKVCLITQELAQRVFGGQDPVAQNIRLGELTFTVIGVFREAVQTYGLSEIRRDTVLIPFPLVKYYTGDNYLRGIYVQMATADEVVPATPRVEELLLARHPAGAAFEVQNLTGILGIAKQISLALTTVLLIIAFIALVISGIGIMNIMLVTVTERTHEIGIRRAIGARRREILWQFLLESVLISGGGAVLGVLGGVSIPVLAQPLLPGGIRVPVPWYAVALALFVSCLTGILFGYLPANKAASLQPTESLRYE